MTKLLVALCVLIGFVAAANTILSQYHIPHRYAEVTKMKAIALKWEVSRHLNGFSVILPAHEANQLVNFIPEAIMMVPDLKADLVHRLSFQDGWHDYESTMSELDSTVKQYPHITEIEEYGKTQGGYTLKAIKIASKTGKPVIVLTGSTHGNELITVEVILGLMGKLVKGYGSDTRITKMVDDHEIWLIPILSPDGYTQQERYCDGVDPNRDFPWVQDPQHKPECSAIQSVMDFYAKHNVNASIDFHSAAGMVFYPWGYTYDSIKDKAIVDRFDKITTHMAEANGYQHGQIAETIYIATGCSADYYYSKFGTWALGVEISQDGSPDLIDSMLEENTESTWRFIESF